MEPTLRWRQEFGNTEKKFLTTLPVPFDIRGLTFAALVWISAGGVITAMRLEQLDKGRNKNYVVGGIIPERPILSFSKTDSLVLSHTANTLQLWRLGKAKESLTDLQHFETGAPLDIAQDHSQILQLALKSKTIISSCLSEDGRYIAVCDSTSFKLFHITIQATGHPVINKIKVPAIAAYSCIFSHDSSKIFVGGLNATVYVLSISQQPKHTVTIEHQFRAEDAEKLPVEHLSLNHDGSFLAFADSYRSVRLYDVKKAQLESLPHFDATISVLKFWNSKSSSDQNPQTKDLFSMLFVITSTNNIFTYDVNTKHLESWPTERFPLKSGFKIRNISFHPTKPQVVVVTMKCLHFITLENQLPSKYASVSSDQSHFGEFLFDAEFVGPNQLAVFGKTLSQLLQHLPPVLNFRKFAT
eukprot:CAMPEP_0168558874 /NCGR_PEP_ID=MMETSP0413-20121227/10214_1 /TAXON_ID=136452 /ORGANISM="Filamoeba nolandi, Strain NC-AS-23-1" /LENGTH=412 /DNA_ID=CAMNT_0008590047 /DNA_START=503 /DNA_END=1741 /DNA_ORIENTATION=+